MAALVDVLSQGDWRAFIEVDRTRPLRHRGQDPRAGDDPLQRDAPSEPEPVHCEPGIRDAVPLQAQRVRPPIMEPHAPTPPAAATAGPAPAQTVTGAAGPATPTPPSPAQTTATTTAATPQGAAIQTRTVETQAASPAREGLPTSPASQAAPQAPPGWLSLVAAAAIAIIALAGAFYVLTRRSS